MKTIPPPCPVPDTGPKYWRSLDHLAESPEFRQWAEREFPAGASEFNDPSGRRNFIKIMSASFLLAGMGAAGCRRPEEHILPFSKMPEGYTHGVSQYYATSMPTRLGAIPLVARSHEGRPIKVEGNSLHPDSNGGTDIYAQASILNLYDPDRAIRHARAGNTVTKEVAVDHLGEVNKKFAAVAGEGLSILAETSASPSLRRLQGILAQALPKAKWHTYDAVDYTRDAKAATACFGQSVRPQYHFEKASVILSLDADFLGNEEESHRYIRDFAAGRRIENPGDKMNRLYILESLTSITGSNADHRLRLAPSQIPPAAAQLASAIIDKASIKDKWLAECAADLLEHAGKALVVAGSRQPLEVHLLATAINQALGAYGSLITLLPSDPGTGGSIADLAQNLKAGSVDTLVILGGNPVYNAPADLDWKAAQAKAKEVIRLGYQEDETAAGVAWHLGRAHYLESWGDAQTSDGTYVPIQPLIEPLFSGLTDLDVIGRIAGVTQPSAYEIVRETFRLKSGSTDFENRWKTFLHDGFLAHSALTPVSGTFNASAVASARSIAAAPAPTKEKLEVVFHRDYSVDDGRYNNNGWLQELPDPISKIVWDNAILVSPKTATDLDLIHNREPKEGRFPNDVVEVDLGGRKVRGAIWILPGLADNTIGLALGYGRSAVGRVGKGTGYNAYPVRTTTGWDSASGAKLTKVEGQKYELATTQEHALMEGRPIIREANLAEFNKTPDFPHHMDLDSHAPNAGGIYEHPYKAAPHTKSEVHQWGMTIDLGTCVGCNACTIACHSENNIPIVGKDQVARGREMHWIRIDRYFSSRRIFSDKQIYKASEDPQVVFQPMLCQHCESAPCESVCPVNATVHDEEGLNVMAYNRCVGTRYCSNNCPYKVRRFNFLDFNKRPLEDLKGPLYPSPIIGSKHDGELDIVRWWKNPDIGTRPGDEWELLKLAKNPDVTVRMRGVMEKCTFCVQRIESAKITQKVKAGASGDVTVPEGTFTTACAQACPAGAIVFGNLLDANSKVSKLKKLQQNYSVLGFLDTKPRLTYLARIRNPNPKMPDYQALPLSTQEYNERNGGHGGGHEAAHAGGAHETKGAH